MNEKDVVRQAMKARGYNQKILADLVGAKTQSAVSERLRGSSMRVDTFIKFLNAMGFDVIVKDRNTQAKENTWVVTDDEEDSAEVVARPKRKKPSVDLGKIFPEGD